MALGQARARAINRPLAPGRPGSITVTLVYPFAELSGPGLRVTRARGGRGLRGADHLRVRDPAVAVSPGPCHTDWLVRPAVA